MHRMREATAEAVATRVLWQLRVRGYPEPGSTSSDRPTATSRSAFAQAMAGAAASGRAARHARGVRSVVRAAGPGPQYDDHMLGSHRAGPPTSARAGRAAPGSDRRFLRGIGWYGGATFLPAGTAGRSPIPTTPAASRPATPPGSMPSRSAPCDRPRNRLRMGNASGNVSGNENEVLMASSAPGPSDVARRVARHRERLARSATRQARGYGASPGRRGDPPDCGAAASGRRGGGERESCLGDFLPRTRTRSGGFLPYVAGVASVLRSGWPNQAVLRSGFLAGDMAPHAPPARRPPEAKAAPSFSTLECTTSQNGSSSRKVMPRPMSTGRCHSLLARYAIVAS